MINPGTGTATVTPPPPPSPPTPTTTPTTTPTPSPPTSLSSPSTSPRTFPSSTAISEPTEVMSTNSTSDKIKIFVILVFYIALIYYYIYSYSKINENTTTTSTKLYFYFSVAMIFLFWTYKIIMYMRNGSDSLLNMEDGYFIFLMAIYFSVCFGIAESSEFNWTYVAIFIFIGLLILPIVYKAITEYLFPSDTSFESSIRNPITIFKNILYPFYVSYAFLFTLIIATIIVVLSFSNKYNIPNSGTWQIWAMIASIIFGFKYFFLNRYSTQNPLVIMICLVFFAILTYLMIIPAEISQTTITLFFTLAFLFFSIIVPTDIPYLNFGLLAIAIAISAFVGLKSGKLQMSTIQVFFIICSLYIVISFSNKIYSSFANNSSKISTLPSSGIMFFLYPIIGIVISCLYLTGSWYSGGSSLTETGNVFYIPLSVMLLSTLIFAGIGMYDKNHPESPFSDGSLIGLFITLIGILISCFYILNKSMDSTTNYPIIFFILFFAFSNLILMIYNLKTILGFIAFIFIIITPIVSSNFLENYLTNKNQYGWIIAMSILMFIWIVSSIFFWKNSGMKLADLFNITSLNLLLSGLMIYFIFYYIYLVFSSKQTMSQSFSQIMLIIMLCYLLLQMFKTTSIAKNPYVAFGISGLEVIPCLYEDLISMSIGIKKEGSKEFSNEPLATKIIGFIVIAVILYTFSPYLKKWLINATHTPGVVLIGDDPLSTNSTHLIKTYEELTNDPEKPLYNYAISFYVYINPNLGPDEYFTIIDFTGNLFVKYNIAQNQLFIYALTNSSVDNEPENAPLYRYNQFPLQKWVKIEINYSGGIYDVFVDNVIKTSNNVVTYNTNGNVFVGEEGSSVIGKVRDLMYYKKPLTLRQIRKTK